MDRAPRLSLRRSARGPRGVTLIELLVVLVVMGILAGVVGLAWRGEPSRPQTGAAAIRTSIAAARGRAIATGTRVVITVLTDSEGIAVTAFPDGAVIGAEQLGIDPLTGGTPDHRLSGAR